MSKSLKQILISGIVVVVIGLGLILFSVIFPDKDKSDPNASASPVITEAPVYYVIREDGESLVSIENTYKDGASLKIDYLRDKDGRLSYEVTPESKFFEYDTSKFRSMMYTMTSLTAVAKIEEEPDDISIYGLDDPQFTMKLTFKDKAITLYVGNTTPVDYNYYVMTDKENTVYTVGNYLGNLIMRTELEFRDIDVFPTYTDEDIYANIDWVKLTQRDGTEIEIVLDTNLSMEGNTTSSAYMMLSPTVSSCNDEKVQSSILDVVATLTYNGVVMDITADKLADFGFNNPARLQMRDISGNMIDITIGKESGTSYYAAFTSQYEECKNNGTELTLLSYSSGAFSWLNLSYMNIINRTVWIQSIHDVQSIDYDMAGTLYHVELERYDDVTGSGYDVVRTVSTLNGKKLSETNTKRLYGRTLNLRQIDSIPEGADLSDPQYIITLNLTDGSKRTLEMVALNERQYACIVDGVGKYYIYSNNLENLLYAFDRLNDDRDIPLIYHT